MAKRTYKPEEIVANLRQVDVLHGHGMPMAEAIRQIGVGADQSSASVIGLAWGWAGASA